MRFIYSALICLVLGQDSEYGNAASSNPAIYRAAAAAEIRDPEPIYQFESLTLPLKRAGKLLLTEATVDGVTGDFIFDTGASGLVLNKHYFPGAVRISGAVASGVTGNSGAAWRTEVKELTLRDLTFREIEAGAVDLSHLENSRGHLILGLLGANLFKSFEVEIDVRAGFVRLIRCDKKGRPAFPAPVECEVTGKLKTLGEGVFVYVNVGTRPLLFGFDTGAEVNVLDSRSGKRVMEQMSVTGRKPVIGTGPQRREVYYGTLESLTIGTTAFHQMETAVMSLAEMSGAYGVQIDGMMGYELLRHGTVRYNVRLGEFKMCLFQKA